MKNNIIRYSLTLIVTLILSSFGEISGQEYTSKTWIGSYLGEPLYLLNGPIRIDEGPVFISDNEYKWSCTITDLYTNYSRRMVNGESPKSRFNDNHILKMTIEKLILINGSYETIPEQKTNYIVILKDFTSDGIIYKDNKVVGHTNKIGDNTVIAENTTNITKRAFYYCKELKKISLPDGITVEDEAFRGCENLTEFTSLGFIKLGDNVFVSCPKLTTVRVSMVPDNIFKGVTSITKVYFDDNIEHIGKNAFEGCISLQSLRCPASLKSIGDEAFKSCTSLRSIEFNDGLTNIGEYAFKDCVSLYSISLPDSYKSVNASSFCDCTSLKNVTLPNGLTSIESSAFKNCSSITDIRLPLSLEGIGSEAFSGCSSITDIRFPLSLESIGSEAFKNCSSLESITLPRSVTYIASWAFSDVPLKTIRCCSPVPPPTVSENAFTSFDAELQLVEGSENCYNQIRPWSYFNTKGHLRRFELNNIKLQIPPGYKQRLRGFIDGTEISPVVYTSTNENICKIDTNGEISVVGITQGNATVIGEYYDQQSGMSMYATCEIEVINPTKESISLNFSEYKLPIYGCLELTADINGVWNPDDKILWASSNPDIATVDSQGYVMTYDTGEVTITAKLENNGNISGSCHIEIEEPNEGVLEYFHTSDGVTVKSFSDNNSIAWLDIPEYIFEDGEIFPVTGISANAFRNNPMLYEVTLPSTLKTIHSGAFNGCSNLHRVNLNAEDLSVIGQYESNPVFGNCPLLYCVNIGENVTKLNPGIFFKSSLVEVNIPENVEMTGTDCFGECASLKKIKIDAPVSGSSVFYGFTNVDVEINTENVKDALTLISGPVRSLTIGDHLKNIVLPQNLPAENLYCYSEQPPILNNDFNGVSRPETILYVPKGYKATYFNAPGWMYFRDMAEIEVPTEADSTTEEDPVEPDLRDAPESVDLGLSVNWSSRNYGTTKAEEYGGHYGWGAPASQSINHNAYPEMEDIGGTQYDVMAQEWGHGYRMPTVDEVEELKIKCRWELTTLNGVNVYKVTGPNGNFIYITASGVMNYPKINDQGVKAFIWCSNQMDRRTGYAFHINSATDKNINFTYKYNGLSLRGVTKQTVNDSNSGVDDIILDDDVNVIIYNLNGVKVFEGDEANAQLAPGFYILVKNGKSIKRLIR